MILSISPELCDSLDLNLQIVLPTYAGKDDEDYDVNKYK